MNRNCGQSPGNRGGGEWVGGVLDHLYTPPPGEQTPRPKGSLRINNQPLPGNSRVAEAPVGWKWGTGAGPSSAQRRQQGLGSGCRPALTPLHPQSLGTGRAPWMVTQKPGCQQLLPGTAHTGLHCFRQESLAATSKAGLWVLSAHGLTHFSRPRDYPCCPNPSSQYLPPSRHQR